MVVQRRSAALIQPEVPAPLRFPWTQCSLAARAEWPEHDQMAWAAPGHAAGGSRATQAQLAPLSGGSCRRPCSGQAAAQSVRRPTAMAPRRSTTMTAAASTAAHPESRKVAGAGSSRGGRRVRGVGTSPG